MISEKKLRLVGSSGSSNTEKRRVAFVRFRSTLGKNVRKLTFGVSITES